MKNSGHLAREPHLVGHHHRHATLCELAQHLQHRLDDIGAALGGDVADEVARQRATCGTPGRWGWQSDPSFCTHGWSGFR